MLTKEDISNLIQICSTVSMPVNQAQTVLVIINKLQAMLKQEEVPSKQK